MPEYRFSVNSENPAKIRIIMQVFEDYFQQLNQTINFYAGIWEQSSLSPELMQDSNLKIYEPFLLHNYAESYANPDYCLARMGETGPYLSALFCQVLKLKDLYYHADPFAEEFKIYLESFENLWKRGLLSIEPIKETITDFSFRQQAENLKNRINRAYCSGYPDLMKIILEDDLSKPDYLYKLNIYVSENELKLSEHISKLPVEKINEIASMFVDAYMRAFPRNNLQQAGRKGMAIYAVAGLEKITKTLILEIKKRGFTPFISNLRSTSFNPQFEYDHKEDDAIFLSEEHLLRYSEQLTSCFKTFDTQLRDFSGNFNFTRFGEKQFSPSVSGARNSFTEKQVRISQKMNRAFFNEREKFIPEESRNYSIIGFPIPEIHNDFEAVFDAFIKVNNLSNEHYEAVQKIICDALDRGTCVHITGKSGNETDLCVKLQPLDDLEKQTGFFNCGADANIPVGEVFTTPLLKGTQGILHIKKAFLAGLLYENLKLHFSDGFVCDYSCTNFENEEDNKEYIRQNLLFPHVSLPMGEFAIGTNTLAYAVSRKFGIVEKLNTLLIEKMGPHFALGDTCYSFMEDIKVYNPDGKEVISKDNENSLKRLDNLDDAYFDVHTYITFPFDEVRKIAVSTQAGEKIIIIQEGKFVLPGTESLNEPFNWIN